MILAGICLLAFLGIAGYMTHRAITSRAEAYWLRTLELLFTGFLGYCAAHLSGCMHQPFFLGVGMLGALVIVGYLTHDAATTANQPAFRFGEFAVAAFFVIVAMTLLAQMR